VLFIEKSVIFAQKLILSTLPMRDKENLKHPIRRDTLIFYLKNSEEYIELDDILCWLSKYSGVEIKQEQKSA
jgi:hypothetical protein